MNGVHIDQKWEHMFINSETGKVYPYLKRVELTKEETSLSVAELEAKYPLNGE